MGLRVEKETFEPDDYDRFSRRLDANLDALRRLLDRPGFGDGEPSLGAELEMSLVGPDLLASLSNDVVLAGLNDSRFTEELDRFNLEYNGSPRAFRNRCLSELELELARAVNSAARVASEHGLRVALIGILPTLSDHDVSLAVMTNRPRYRALAAGLKRQRTGPFHLRIDGAEPLDLAVEDVTVEGANTSLQVHLRVRPAEFPAVYNAVQLATAPVLALSGNSPTFLGHRLWDETRIALFKQAVDARTERDPPPRAARVSFGNHWVDDAYELFEESVRLHAPLLPVTGHEDAPEMVSAGRVPGLAELRLHHGTVWRWNRAVYDPSFGGHLRIEVRALPSGPSIVDMVANAGFLLGLALDLAASAGEWVRAVPFALAEDNFYRAAQHGPDATLGWFDGDGGLRSYRAAELVRSLTDRACRGLERAGVSAREAQRYVTIFAERARRERTGARWQRRRLEHAGVRSGRVESMQRMFADYLALCREGAPVHTWRAG